jgi:23S rRNA pseudouridine2604 synthase
MATLKLKKSPEGSKPASSRRAPLRGPGVSRPRPTLEQARAERAERQAAFEQRRAEEALSERRSPHGAGAPRPQRGDRDDRGERPDRGGRPPRPEHMDRMERADRPSQRGRQDGPQGPQRPESGGRPDRPQRSDRSERFEPSDRRDRRDQAARPGERGADRHAQWPGDRPRGPRGDGRHDAAPRRQDGAPARWQDEAPAPTPRAPRPPAPRINEAEGERLSKRMSELGLASRREADEWIAAGWVKVDGRMAELGQRVGPDARIEVDPAARQQQAQRVTILLHKPIGYVSGQAEDGYEPAAVLVKGENHWKDDASGLKFAPGHGRGLAPAGRLDIDSTGLLVLTQDGRVAKLLIGEDSQVEKEYLVRVALVGGAADQPAQAQLPAQALALLNHGLELDGVQLQPAKVSWANEDQLRFVLREGRKRQIRRMCELVGLQVLALKRVRIGRIPLGHLPPGQWRYLAPWERFD